MNDESSQHYEDLLRRIRDGERQAQDELINAVCDRLEMLTRRMLRRYPAVRALEQTNDILQQALVRLMRSLPRMEVASTRDFYNLAAVHIRRVLVDMARRYSTKVKPCAVLNLEEHAPETNEQEPIDSRDDPDELARWTALHESVEALPCAERETFSLIFYHGWSQIQVAELFKVDERTVRRRWRAACEELYKRLGGELPS